MASTGEYDPLMPVRDAFDARYYLATHPDVAASDLTPFDHFMTLGWREGRNPTPWFSVAAYLDAHLDVRESELNPFTHYIEHGRAEGRSLGARPLPGTGAAPAAMTGDEALREAFDAVFYIASNPDLTLAKSEAFDHFMEAGWREGRDPNPDFSLTKYLNLNPDVHSAGLNPFDHYIRYGRREGRPISHGFDFRNDILRNMPPFEDHLAMLRRTTLDPALDAIDTLEAALADPTRRSRLHITVSQDNYTTLFGGIQLCLRLEAEAVRAEGADHLHLFPAATGMVVEVIRDHPPVGIILNGELLGVFAPADIVEAIGRARHRPEIDFAVHSLIGHTVPDLIDILGAFGARAGVYWVHDYSSLCAGYALMRNDVSFCGAPPVDSPACGVCMYGPRRRVQIAEHARLFDRFAISVIAPSDTALSLWRRSFPRTPEQSVAQPHAVLSPRDERPRRPARQDGPVRIGFLGMPSNHKGWPVFAALVEAFRADPRYEFHHLAHSAAPAGRAIFTEVSPTVEAPTPMSDVVANLELDVAVIWSLWPETFCFTAYEAVAGGALVLTNPGAGNVTVLARDPSCGLVVESEAALFEMLTSGEVVDLARQTPRAGPGTLAYAGMTADFIGAR